MPVKQAKRQICVALGLVLNANNELLLGKRHDPRNRGMHGRWEFPGGKVEFGENPEETVVRECSEEVNLRVIPEKLIKVYSWFHPDRPHIQVILMAYIVRAEHPESARPNCKEVRAVEWVTLEKAMTMELIENNKVILRDLKNIINPIV